MIRLAGNLDETQSSTVESRRVGVQGRRRKSPQDLTHRGLAVTGACGRQHTGAVSRCLQDQHRGLSGEDMEMSADRSITQMRTWLKWCPLTTRHLVKRGAVAAGLDQIRAARELEEAYCGQSPIEFLLFHVNETLVGCAATPKTDVESIDESTACEQLTPLIERVLD